MPAQPVAVQISQPREPTPEERRLLAAYEREQQAIAAPTTLRDNFGSAGFATSQQAGQASRNNGDDAAQLASMIQALSRQSGGGSPISPDTLRSLAASRAGSGSEAGDESDQNMQGRKEGSWQKHERDRWTTT